MERAGNLLLVGTDTVASWSADGSPIKDISLTYNGSSISFGTQLSEKGTLGLSVSNEAGKSSYQSISLTDEAIMGLSTLEELLQVDQETDLLQGLTLARGFELVKTEIEFEGQRTGIADATHFTQGYPGTCSLFFTVKRNGVESEVKAEKLTIKPLDYEDGTLEAVDIIKETYPWYNNLQQSTKDFIYPHILASYAACNWSKLDNRVHIIMGETPDADDVENI